MDHISKLIRSSRFLGQRRQQEPQQQQQGQQQPSQQAPGGYMIVSSTARRTVGAFDDSASAREDGRGGARSQESQSSSQSEELRLLRSVFSGLEISEPRRGDVQRGQPQDNRSHGQRHLPQPMPQHGYRYGHQSQQYGWEQGTPHRVTQYYRGRYINYPVAPYQLQNQRDESALRLSSGGRHHHRQSGSGRLKQSPSTVQRILNWIEHVESP